MEELEEKELCQTCKQNKSTEYYHTCPYLENLNNDTSSLCNCCEDCQDMCNSEV